MEAGRSAARPLCGNPLWRLALGLSLEICSKASNSEQKSLRQTPSAILSLSQAYLRLTLELDFHWGSRNSHPSAFIDLYGKSHRNQGGRRPTISGVWVAQPPVNIKLCFFVVRVSKICLTPINNGPPLSPHPIFAGYCICNFICNFYIEFQYIMQLIN
jgi:hypothetical protein